MAVIHAEDLVAKRPAKPRAANRGSGTNGPQDIVSFRSTQETLWQMRHRSHQNQAVQVVSGAPRSAAA